MRIRMSLRPLAAAAVAVGALAFASSASAATPTGDYAKFKYCPYQTLAPLGGSCLLSQTTSGEFKLGNSTVPIPSGTTVTLQGGFYFNGTGWAWSNAANGGTTMPAVPLKVPGGLIGLVNTGGWSGVLIDLFNAAVASVNDVYATAELAGPIQFNYINLALGLDDPGFVLPIKVHLTNPFLGSSCYIGSNSNPVTLRLTTGTTHPPAGVTPLTGTAGVVSGVGDIQISTGLKIVDNTFSVPAASNCGYLILDKLLITAGVNLKEGLPSAAGNNRAILQGNSYIGTAQSVLDHAS